MKTASDILYKARTILRQASEQNPSYAYLLSDIRIEVSRRMTKCAGLAIPLEKIIRLSLPFYADDANFEKDLSDTVTHEAAHIIAQLRALSNGIRIKWHGPEWRAIHRSLGGSGERCHNLKLAAGFKARRKQELTPMPCCICGQRILLKPARARTYAAGIKAGSMGPGTGFGFHHKDCKP